MRGKNAADGLYCPPAATDLVVLARVPFINWPDSLAFSKRLFPTYFSDTLRGESGVASAASARMPYFAMRS
jgi:hypothetical protein